MTGARGPIGWLRLYRWSLWLLPTDLRRKHGAAMGELFEAELARADGVFGLFTALYLAAFQSRRPGSPSLDILLLAIPFIAALTIPVATFVAALRVGRQLGAHAGTPVPGWSTLRPLLVVMTVVACATLVLVAVLVPRTKARLSTVMAGHVVARGDRSMTLSELRAASRTAPRIISDETPADANTRRTRAASVDVEIHKKFALAGSCVVLALAGLLLGWRVRRSGLLLTGSATVAVGIALYVGLAAGESLAERAVIAPWLGMWATNLLLLALTGSGLWAGRRARPATIEAQGTLPFR